MSAPDTPLVSVVIPVSNGMPFLRDALESIVRQTLSEIEIVILDNGSNDGTGRFVSGWRERDQRIVYRRVEERLGIGRSSNAAVELARAPLVARMDADDVSHPDRIRRQFVTMQSAPTAALVATLHEGIDQRGRKVMPRDLGRLLSARTTVPFCHGSIMFTKEAFNRVGGYGTDAEGWTDLEFYLRLSSAGQILVIPDALYSYRFHPGNHSAGIAGADRIRSALRLQRALEAKRNADGGRGSAQEARRRAPTVATSRWFAAGMKVWSGYKPPGWTTQPAVSERSEPIGTRARVALLVRAATISPKAVRASLRLYIRCRNLLVRPRIRGKEFVTWRFEP